MSVDDSLGPFDFVVNAFVWIVGAVRTVHGEAPLATWANIHNIHRGGETGWSPPIHEMRRIRPQLENEFSRRPKDSRRCDFAVAGIRRIASVFRHENSPCFLVVDREVGSLHCFPFEAL